MEKGRKGPSGKVDVRNGHAPGGLAWLGTRVLVKRDARFEEEGERLRVLFHFPDFSRGRALERQDFKNCIGRG
jgi:hypothetical protein